MKLYCRRLGEGPAIVILHGLFGSSDNWATFGRQLAEQGYSVYLADQRNHGRSPHSPEFNYTVMAEDVQELIAQERLRAPVIAGHSMGGKTAMAFCGKFPGVASGLIVIDIAPRYYPPHHMEVIEALLQTDPPSATSRKEAESRLMKHVNDPDTAQFLLKNLYWDEQNRLAWRFNLDDIVKNIEQVGSAIDVSSPVPVPALFVRGERSNYVTAEDEPEIRRMFPGAEIKTAPAAGHWVHADNPQWLLQTVLPFLNGVRAGSV